MLPSPSGDGSVSAKVIKRSRCVTRNGFEEIRKD